MDLPLVGRRGEFTELERVLANGGSAVVMGEPGVGKTRLVQEAVTAWRRGRGAVELMAGSTTGRQLPFGVVASLLPAVDAADPHQLIQLALATLGRRNDATPLLLVVDDAHLLDPGSALLMQHIILDRTVRCLLTVRTHECPDVLSRLSRDHHAARIELAPLDRDDTAMMVAALLEGDVALDLQHRVWDATRGNPLFIREVIEAGSEQAHLRPDDAGVWRLVDRLPVSRELVNTIEDRVADLDPDMNRALELIAVGEPLRLAVLLDLATPATLGALDARQLISVDRDTERLSTRHPLYGEVLRTAMSPFRGAEVARELSEALVRTSLSEPGDAMLAARLLIGDGRPIDNDLAVAAGREAIGLFDAPLAERILRQTREPSSFEVQLLVGRSLRLQNRGVEAERALEAAAWEAAGEAQVAEAGLARARNLGWGLGDLVAAQGVLEQTIERITDESWKAMLESELALQLARVGDFARGRDVATAARRRHAIEPRAELTALTVSCLARSMTLDTQGVDAELDRGLELAAELRASEPLATDQLLLVRAQLLAYGDPPAAVELSAERSLPGTPMLGMWHAAGGMARLITGDLAGAVSNLRDASVVLGELDPFANLEMAWAIHAVALAQTGRWPEFRARRPDLLAMRDRPQPRTAVWAGRGLGWERALAGDAEGAIEVVVAGADFALEHDHVGWGVEALYDVVRMGCVERVVDRLVSDTSGCGLVIPTLFGEHATALAERDGTALEMVADRFSEVGAWLFAAEASAQAAHVHLDGGRPVAVTRAAVRAQSFAHNSSGAVTPVLVGIDRLGLSRRQGEVARLAAQGATNRDIAGHFGLSLRTVENHLAGAYRKLDVAGRAELRDVIPVSKN